MRHNPFFKLLCMVVLSVYGVTVAQAGQVIMPDERQWAKDALARESQLGAIKNINSVAVLNFHNKTGQNRLDVLQKGMALMLITDLAKVDNLHVIERIRIQALVEEMELGKTGLVDLQSAPKVGKLLKAYYAVSGDILQDAVNDIQFEPAILDVPLESIIALPRTAGGLDELSRIEKELLFTIIDALNIEVSPAKREELKKPLSLSTAALLALFTGIDLSDRGEYTEAARMYDQALIEDPNLDIARDALQELKDMGLIPDNDLAELETAAAEEPPAAEDGGIGMGTIVAGGLGLAALAGGALLLINKSDDDNEGEGEKEGGKEEGKIVTVTPVEVSDVSCQGGSINFTFSEPMDQGYGKISYTPALSNIKDNWVNGTTLRVEWNDICSDLGMGPGYEESFVIQLRGFRSVRSSDVLLDAADCTVRTVW